MKTLFGIILSAAITLSVNGSFAQTIKKDSTEFDLGKEINKVFSTKVSMDVDTILFNTRQGNFYFNEASKAMIMTMVVPQSIARLEEDFNKKDKKKDIKIIETKKFTHDGRQILFQRGLLKKDGNKILMYMYGVEATPESSIMLTCTHAEGEEKKFFPAIERAALSAKLAEAKK
jgi:hypothetical protein